MCKNCKTRKKKEKKKKKEKNLKENNVNINLISSFLFLIYNLFLNLIFAKMIKIYTYNYF